MIATKPKTDHLNGVNVPALQTLIETVKNDPSKALTRWGVTTRWAGGTVSETEVTGCEISGKRVPKDFTIRVDEPLELAGTNTAPNPQETLLAAFNACMLVGYVALSALHGIELKRCEIESDGDIDVRGFLALDPTVKVGYDHIRYTVRISGNGTPEQFERIHQAVMATSPNRFNLAQPIALKAKLILD